MSHCDSPGLMPIEQAVSLQNAAISPITETELVSLSDAGNRVIAKDVVSPVQVPPVDNSAMDGFALRAEDSQQSLYIAGEALAGHPYSSELRAGQAIRIMTGAPVPKGANAVIMQEQTRVSGNDLLCEAEVRTGQCIRKAGEDIQRNSVVIKRGETLNAAHISLLASIGVPQVEVFRKPKVAILATGDELVIPGDPIQPGQIFESNRSGLKTMLQKLPVEIVDLGIIPDDLDATREAFNKASQECDWVISSGGVSVGEADYVKQVLDELGKIDFWKVAIKPGKPYAFGALGSETKNSTYFSGLPGNPVSSFVTFMQLVLPSLVLLSGGTWQPPMTFKAKLANSVKRRPGRTDFQRAQMWNDENGQLWVAPKGKQGSGIMNSFTNANCFLIIPAKVGTLEVNELVTVQPFSSLLA